ncbi:hypothetical protein LZ198_28005 [Myxococcus sp. K15C18031901]|uniref:hypothetical protein n=1 Tax=Myxococcus dinghuensis TaxID=2906761 RepID=UPI0020A74DE3|nr:hypothetical protein [Myxococcus dinghuensis]MCP3102726.1 hypothetical protein [Myxococcus dinghuensis]
MMNRKHWMWVVAGALVLVVGLGLWWRPAEGEGVADVAALEEASAPEVPASEAPRARPAVAPKDVAAGAERPSEEPRGATVVALGPGDVPPEPEVENPPPQENEPIAPELPQTAQWKLEKTTHITGLLGRDVERLERERETADTRGDDARVRQLDTLIQRQRGRLVGLREEIRVLTEEAAKESAAQ